MEKKFIIKFSDGIIRGPYLENEIDDMIYDNSLSGEEKIREYPDGDWKDIAKTPHFYDVFLGAFEADKGPKRNEKETFVDSPTATNIKKEEKKDEPPLEKTVIQKDRKSKETRTGSIDKTQLYNQQDVKNISDSLIKTKKDGVIDPDQRSPIIPQAVIVSLEEERPGDNIKLKLVALASIVIAVFAVFYFMFSSDTTKVIDVNGVKLEKVYTEITLPVAESSIMSPKESASMKDQALTLIIKDDINSYKKAVELLLASYEADTTNYNDMSYLAYCYSMLYNVSKKDTEYLNSLKAIISRAEKTDTNIQSTTLAKMSYAIIQKNYNGAITSFNEMLNALKDPTKVEDQLLIAAAEAAIGQNDYNAAFQILTKINKSNNIYPRAYYLEGLIRINNKEYEIAASLFRKALEINPKHVLSMVRLFELGKDATALNIFNYAKDNYMNSSHDDISIMLYLLGNIMVQNNDVEKAKYFYEKALDFSASNAKAMIAYEQLGGSIAKYKKEFMPSTMPNPETSTFLMRGDELYRLQKYRDASLQYRMAASLDPQNTNSWYKLGEAYRMTYEYSKAMDAYNESLKTDKLAVLPMIRLARVQTDLYKFQDAADNLKRAQEIDPDNPDVLFAIGYLSDKRNMEETAVKYYHKAVSKDFSHVDSLLMLAKINYKYERYAEAKLLFEKVLNSQPDNFEAYVYITLILAKTEHISKVEKYIETLQRTFPEVAELNAALGMAYMMNANYDLAEKEFKKGKQKNQYSITNLKAYAELSEKLGRNKDALSYYETVAIIAPYYLDAINQKVNIYCNLGQTASCEQELLRLVDLTPAFPKAYYTLGKLYYKSGQLEDAREALNREIGYNPSIRDSYLLLGDVYIKLNQPQKAIELFRGLLVLNKKDPYAMLGLAKSYYAGKDFEGAENTVTQARHIDPNINDIYFLECQLYFQMNRYAESKNSCDEYIKRAPDDEKAREARDLVSKITKG